MRIALVLTFFVVQCGQKNSSKVSSLPQSSNGEKDLLQPQTDDTLAVSQETFAKAVRSICQLPSGKRSFELLAISKYRPGSRVETVEDAIRSEKACIDFLLPSAIYTNLISGIPSGILIGQALQETGFCKSDLAQKSLNFHGQKANLGNEGFTYWHGDAIEKASTESKTGSGNLKVSKFMRFTHVDYGFITAAERMIHPNQSAYKGCMALRHQAEPYIRCVAKDWASDLSYANKVLNFRSKYSLNTCELDKSEWKLSTKFESK